MTIVGADLHLLHLVPQGRLFMLHLLYALLLLTRHGQAAVGITTRCGASFETRGLPDLALRRFRA